MLRRTSAIKLPITPPTSRITPPDRSNSGHHNVQLISSADPAGLATKPIASEYKAVFVAAC